MTTASVVGLPDGGHVPPRAAMWLVDFKGAGPIHVGMSVKQASAALHAHFPGPRVEDTLTGYARCRFYYAVPPTAPPGVSFMVEDDTILRVDVRSGSVSTVDGVHIGTTDRQLRTLYGDRLERGQSLGMDDLLILSSPDVEHRFLIIFDMTHGKVSSYRAGERSAAQIEECA